MSKQNDILKSVPSVIPHEIVKDMIFIIRGQKVILDFDLSALYGVETKILKELLSGTWDVFQMILCLNFPKKNIRT